MAYRVTPINATGVSPVQLIMGRQIHTKLPQVDSLLKPKWLNLNKVREFDRESKDKYQYMYNKKNAANDLPKLHPGDHVLSKSKGERLV